MKEKNEGLRIFLLIAGITGYLILTVIMSVANASGLTEAAAQGQSVNYNGVFSQIQVILSTMLVITNQKRGFVTVCILNAFSMLSGIMSAMHSPQAVPGTITPVITIANMSIIYAYLAKSESQQLKLKDQYTEIMDSNRLMQEKDEALRTLAYTDRLTGMKNMQYFREQVEEAVRQEQPFSVIHMNIDGFKSINDTFGPKTGDTALAAYAERIRNFCGETYLCARSSDEFSILLTGEQTEAAILDIIQQIRRLFSDRITVQGTSLSVTACYGIIMHPRDGRNAETLLDSAVMAVYSAKADGRDRQCFYAQSM